MSMILHQGHPAFNTININDAIPYTSPLKTKSMSLINPVDIRAGTNTPSDEYKI